MDRRTFLSTVGGAVLLAPSNATAQSVTKPFLIAILGAVFTPDIDSAFKEGLANSGLVLGRDFTLDQRAFAGGTPTQADAAASELLRSKPDMVVAWGTVGAVAVKKARTNLPVVFLSVGVPVEIGLIASLAHPGGNMTGVTFEAAAKTYPKRLQLLKDILPRTRRVGILYAAGDPNVTHALTSLQSLASDVGVQMLPVEVKSANDLESAFATFTKQGAEGLVVVAGSFTFVNGRRIAELALANRLPLSGAFRQTVADGGLLSLGPDYQDMARQGARIVAKALKGAKPADLPVEQPTRFELVINLKTAKALGLTIPPSVLLRADQVIQ